MGRVLRSLRRHNAMEPQFHYFLTP